MTASASCCATIAHAPKPASATVMPATAPTTVAAIWRSSSRRNCMSRTSSASCVVPSALTKKPTESAAKSGRDLRLAVEARERPGEREAGEHRARARSPALVQNTVERSSSARSRRWISAVPSALSVKTTTKPENDE